MYLLIITKNENKLLHANYQRIFSYVTFKAYFPSFVIPNVCAIWEFVGSTTTTIPFQSGVRSDDLQLPQTFATVIHLHFLHEIGRAHV